MITIDDLKYARSLASTLQKWAKGAGLASCAVPVPQTIGDLYRAVVTHPELDRVTAKLFADGHYALAVEEAFKCVNNAVKSKSGIARDGNSLMTEALKPDQPVLKLNALKTTSERDEQTGYMMILGGCMTGIRNPRAHEHYYRDHPEAALEMLTLANHLLGKIDNAKRTRRSKTR